MFNHVRDFSLCPFYGDQIQVALHLLNYNCINYKVFVSCAKFENSMQIPLLEISHDSILGAFMLIINP